jgi:molybdopterin-guanine dinucleotide biosynthesis protein A
VRPALVAVLAGGRGRRMGGAKPTADLGGRPLVAWPLAAAREAGLEAVVVAKAATPLPALDVPVWIEPDEPSHPLAGLVFALGRARGPVVAAACDMPFVGAELLARLAAAGGAAAARADQPFPGRYEPAALPVLRDVLAREAPVRMALAALAPVELGAPPEALTGVNTPAELAAAAALLGRGAPPHAGRGAARVGRVPPSAEHWIEAFAAALGRPAPTAEERGAVLKLASVAAHASERRAAPIACWLAAASGVSLDEAIVLAQELSGGPDVSDP